MNYRPERVSNLIREELANLIQREMEFEPGVLVTLTYVDVDKKLGRAKVGVSVLPSEKATLAMARLREQAKNLQFQLLRKINIKPMPQIIFELDRGLENAAEVEKALLKDNNK